MEPDSPAADRADAPLRSVHTTTLPAILAELGGSLLATTYQAGKLVVLRERDGVLNTHFRIFSKPMGLALRGGRLAVGCAHEIWEFHNVSAACRRLDARDITKEDSSPADSQVETPPLHDACFVPRSSHVTGDVQIHEMAWVGDDLWFVNTEFSCLATRNHVNSFQPRWRPGFVTELRPGDCCHLNGLAVRDGSVRYVTALGETNSPGGWREHKRNGGVLIDVASQEVIARGLSMPHSPRWHAGKLWLLESGDGSLGTVDLATGRYEPIAKFPGFTRGLSFFGPLAFVGLSQVRESAVFSGIPLVERLPESERACGVWILHVESGEVLGFVRFEDAVQEIFAVECLPGMRFPDVVNDDPEFIGRTYVLDDAALGDVPQELRAD
jgi:uncharacterized protein (TIGR03032 family)